MCPWAEELKSSEITVVEGIVFPAALRYKRTEIFLPRSSCSNSVEGYYDLFLHWTLVEFLEFASEGALLEGGEEGFALGGLRG